ASSPKICEPLLDLRLALDRALGQRVGAFVFGVAGVALDPVPLDLMRRRRGFEPLPQIEVLDRLFVGSLPPARLPRMQPARDPVAQIAAVGVEPDPARPL